VTLVELRAAYEADRAEVDAKHPPLPLPGACRYCRKSWRLWKGVRFDGHVRCVVSRSFMRQLVVTMRGDPRLTYVSVAAALDLSPAVIRAWWKLHTERRRA
jgi:hypothetical protein